MRNKDLKSNKNHHQMMKKRAFLLLLLALTGATGAWGQTTITNGLYYIASRSFGATNFYLCPTEGWKYYQSADPYYTDSDNGQPFMTTYTCLENHEPVYNSQKA